MVDNFLHPLLVAFGGEIAVQRCRQCRCRQRVGQGGGGQADQHLPPFGERFIGPVGAQGRRGFGQAGGDDKAFFSQMVEADDGVIKANMQRR